MWLVKQHPIARTVCKGSWAKNAVVELLYKRRKWWNFSYTLRHVYAWQFWGCEWTRMILASNKCVTGWCSMMFPFFFSVQSLSCFDFAIFCIYFAYQAISGSGHLPWVLTCLDVLRLFGKVPRLFPVERPGFWCCVLSTCDSDHIGSSLTRQLDHHVASDPVWHAQQHQLSFFQLGRLVPRLLMFSAWR